MSFANIIYVTFLTAGMTLVANLVGYKNGIVDSIPGMLILIAICLLGVVMAKFIPGGLPSDEDQDTFIKEQCADLTEAYLDPVAFRATTLTLFYKTIGLPSWTAGSRQVACRIGATLGNGGWATLVNTAKGPLLINGQPPIPPPEIPAERLNQLPGAPR